MTDNKYERIIENIINSDDWTAKKALACHCEGDEDVLNRLLKTSHNDGRVTPAIAENCNGNFNILIKLCDSEDRNTRAAAARFSNGNTAILNVLVTDDEPLVKEWVAKTCNGNLDILNALADKNEPWVVRNFVAKSCNGNKALLERLYKEADNENDPKGIVRKSVRKEMRAYKIKEPISSDIDR